jgi:benzylsuccinate CoA-transferase BbsE subunit
MLSGIHVGEIGDASGWLAGRILSDLGADVVLLEPEGGTPERARIPYAFAALCAGKRSTFDPSVVADADIVIEAGPPSARADTARAPQQIWCTITPFGRTGPKSAWRATDLSVQAQSGTQHMTGDPDRAPLRCTYPTSWYHGCAEATAAILIALWQRETIGAGQIVDVSLQEAHLMANMSRSAQFGLNGQRGARAGALMRVGKTVQREIWPCKDGFVTFGLRGGAARIPGLKRLVAWMAEEKMATPALLERDWDSYNHNNLTAEEVDDISEPIGHFFGTKTMVELYDAALARGLMLAPANTATEILGSRQYRSRNVFMEVEDPTLGRIELPRAFVVSDAIPGLRGAAPRTGEHTETPWAR